MNILGQPKFELTGYHISEFDNSSGVMKPSRIPDQFYEKLKIDRPPTVTLPTVDLGFLLVVFCSIEIAGERPSIKSTSGLCIICRNCLA